MANDFDVYIRFLVDKAAEEGTSAAIHSLTDSMGLFKERIAETRAEARELRQVGRELGQLSREISVVGLALAGGIFAAANKYVKDAKVATEVTEKWKAAQESLAESGSRVGSVLATTALPLLEKAAKLADVAAGFVEKNPKIVSAALNTGLVLAGLGAVGVAVSKGIQFVADLKLLAAFAQEQIGYIRFAAAVHEFSIAAGLVANNKYGVAGGLIGPAEKVAVSAGGTAVGAIAGTALATILGLIGGVAINDVLAKAGSKYNASSNKWATVIAYDVAKNIFEPIGKAFGFNEAEMNKKTLSLTKLVAVLTGARPADMTANGNLGVLSDKDLSIAKAYSDWKTADAKITQTVVNERVKILKEGATATQAATQKYQTALNSIRSNAGSITSKYEADSKAADIQFVTDKSKIVSDGNQAILNIETQSKKDLEKLSEDHNRNMSDLLGQRDALGLVKEQENYDRARADKIKETQTQIRERKQETAIALQDLAQRFTQEQAQRKAQYKEELKQDAIQVGAQRAAAYAAYQEELKSAREAQAQKLRDLEDNAKKEKSANRAKFIDSINNLDSALLGEQKLKNSYYAAMLKDAQSFMASYRNALGGSGSVTNSASATTSSGGGILSNIGHAIVSTFQGYASTFSGLFGGTKDSGGYVGKGVYRMAWDGNREFVLNNAVTRAAERIIGGNITQDGLLMALTGSRTNVNYSDQRRFNAGMSAQDRRAIRNDTQELLEGLIRG